MKLDVITIFPDMVRQALDAGIIGRAVDREIVDITVRDLRDYTTDRHRTVDDVPFGGGPGMVLKPEPLFRAVAAIEAERGKADAVGTIKKPGPLYSVKSHAWAALAVAVTATETKP